MKPKLTRYYLDCIMHCPFSYPNLNTAPLSTVINLLNQYHYTTNSSHQLLEYLETII